jgi:hypothetical protein
VFLRVFDDFYWWFLFLFYKNVYIFIFLSKIYDKLQNGITNLLDLGNGWDKNRIVAQQTTIGFMDGPRGKTPEKNLRVIRFAGFAIIFQNNRIFSQVIAFFLK